MDILVAKLALIGLAGVGAQWAAWRFNFPGIVLMALAGLILGPALGVLDPAEDFGALLQPMISVAVAVILFEGGLSLNFQEIRGAEKAVRRLVFPGVVIAWGAGAAAAHWLAGLSWPIAALLAGILVVTGPTVIIPLLRQARLSRRPAALLKWEGIINDPIGAVLAVLVFEWIVLSHEGGSVLAGAALLAFGVALATALGFLAGRLLAEVFRRGWAPEYLKAPITLVVVLAVFGGSNLVENETGLLAVTAMGVTMANARITSIDEMRRFKESIAVLMVSGVFVILTATLQPASLVSVGWGGLAFVAAILFFVRPLTVWVATFGKDITWREKLLVGWIAPRGVVAAAIAGLFSVKLTALGFAEAALLTPLAFAVIFATVVAHGFTIGPLAKSLGLASREAPGVLIVGASAWSVEFAKLIKEIGAPVTIADPDWRRLRPARQAEIETYFGEILSEASEHHIDFNRFGYLIAATGNEAYNALVFTDLAPEIGRAATFQLGGEDGDEARPRSFAHTIKGRPLLPSRVGLEEVLRRHYAGWTFQKTKLTEEFTLADYLAQMDEKAEIILIKRKSGALSFVSTLKDIKADIGDMIVAYAPPQIKERADVRDVKESAHAVG